MHWSCAGTQRRFTEENQGERQKEELTFLTTREQDPWSLELGEKRAGFPRVAGKRYGSAVHTTLLAALPSPQSTTKKMDVIKGLFVACRHSEARYIAR